MMAGVVNRQPGLFSRRVGEEYLIEGYIDAYAINSTGEAIWLLCGRGLTSEQISTRIAEKYQVGIDDAQHAVTEFVVQLIGLGFVHVESAPAEPA